MKELQKSYIAKLEQVKVLAEKYGLKTDSIQSAIEEIKDFKITAPLVGSFSTGKSSLLNAVLGEDILSTDITPETAVPAEICYGKNGVVYCLDNGKETGTIGELNTKKLSIEREKLVRISIENEFLKTIPTVKIVDMPGFDSGYEMHNRAIDDYLPKSLAYIITVSAEEGTVKASVLNFLNELKLNKMPVYLVITKSDKIRHDEIDDVTEHIRKTAEQRLGIDHVATAVTSAADDETEGFKNILTELQSRSEEVFINHFSTLTMSFLNDIKGYIESRLKVKDHSSAQLEEDIRLLEESILSMQTEIEKEKQKFEAQCDSAAETVCNKAVSALEASSSVLENMLYNGNDISEKINIILRAAITEEIHRSFEPKVRKYTENIAEIVSRNIAGTNVEGISMENINSEKNDLNNIASASIPVLTTAITSILAHAIGPILGPVLGPILGPLGVVVGAVLGLVINSGIRKREEKQKREAAAQKAREVIESIRTSLGASVKETIYKIRDDINDVIEKEISAKIEVQKKSLNDAREKLSLNEEEQAKNIFMLTADMQIVESMIREESAVGYVR